MPIYLLTFPVRATIGSSDVIPLFKNPYTTFSHVLVINQLNVQILVL